MADLDNLHYPRRPGDPEPTAAELARVWNQASEQLFSSALLRPDVYQRTTRLVGAVTAELRLRGRGADPLVAAWRAHEDLVRRVAEGSDLLTTEGVELELVAGAAFALRYREVLDEVVVDERLAVLSTSHGGDWVVLEEKGFAPGDPFIPYRRLEVLAGSGRAILVRTQPDESYGSCIHSVEQGFLDLETGHLSGPGTVEPGSPDAGGREFSSAEQREAYVDAIKAGSDTPGNEPPP